MDLLLFALPLENSKTRAVFLLLRKQKWPSLPFRPAGATFGNGCYFPPFTGHEWLPLFVLTKREIQKCLLFGSFAKSENASLPPSLCPTGAKLKNGCCSSPFTARNWLSLLLPYRCKTQKRVLFCSSRKSENGSSSQYVPPAKNSKTCAVDPLSRNQK